MTASFNGAPFNLKQYYASGGPFGSAVQTDYRYLTTSVLSGALMGDYLPMEPQSFSDVINGGGTFTGSLNLVAGVSQQAGAENLTQQNQASIAAATPRKAMLWALQDGTPVWSGILWDWVPTTILQAQMPVQGATLDFLLSRRFIETDLVFNAYDVFDMARAIVQYAFSKGPGYQVAGVTYSTAKSGITDSLTFDGSQNQDCLTALNTLVSTYGIEFHFRPYMDQTGGLHISFDLGYPALGQPYPASGLAYSFPGNLLDYAFTATGSTGANRLIGSAQNSTTGTESTGVAFTGSAVDDTDIANGYPVTEQVVSPTGVTFGSDAQVSAYCAGLLPSYTATQLAPMVVLGNGQYPPVAVTQLGSYCSVAFTSPLHPANPDGSPGFTGTGRVVSWTLYPPTSQQAEYTECQLGAMPFEGSTL
jgi:hypothetical protein